MTFHAMVNPRSLHPYYKKASPLPASWSLPDICKAYNWPSDLEGGGAIGIVELGGGWSPDDMHAFFQSIGQPVPSITNISVDGLTNQYGSDPQGADVEVTLDIQIAAAAYFEATGKPAIIRVYWAQNIAPAVQMAANQGCRVCSISWGADEANWGETAAKEMAAVAVAAMNTGCRVIAAAGDNDSSDGGLTPANVDLPASAPNVLACGGTSKPRNGGPEMVWNNNPGNADGQGTGGGWSTIFPFNKLMQPGAPIASAPKGAGRMVPDVAANADPNTGYEVYVHGSWTVVGGTSCVAPLYAGLLSAINSPLVYGKKRMWYHPAAFNDITTGDNGMYSAGVGPDPCTGLGVPNGASLRNIFIASLAAFMLVLNGCSGITPPAQPTPESVMATENAIAAIPGDPVTVLTSGIYSVHVACDAYLNAAAARNANISLASTGIGTSGVAAAGFLAAGGNPTGAAAAAGIASLAQTLLSQYQTSGALPYASGTTTLIQNSLAAYEGALMTPETTVEAMLDIEGDWWQCSPGGYAQNMEKAATTASVTAIAAPTSIPNFALLEPRSPSVFRRPPTVKVNGQ